MAAIPVAGRVRSHLYVPADNAAMREKAASRGADALILDLEDAVAPTRKLRARAEALAFARGAAQTPSEVWIRVNDGELGLADLAEVAGAPGVDGIWLPKAEPGPWLDAALATIGAVETKVGLLIESAIGMARLAEFPALPAGCLVQIGEADLSASLRIEGREDQLLVFRSMVVLEWAARGLPAPVAPVSASLTDLDAYRRECERMLDWGFVGRACVHPAQVVEANAVWSVTEADIERARQIVGEFEAREAEGIGAFRSSGGTMVDRATIRWARSVLAGVDELPGSRR